MPFTPFHFGSSAVIAIPFQKRIDIISFVLVSVVIDLEPLFVMLLSLNYPLHGYAHTFIGGGVIGVFWGTTVYLYRKPFSLVLKKFKLKYDTSLRKSIVSGVLGGFFHILIDAPLYTDIKPFYPFDYNPFLGLISHFQMYFVSGVLFIICGLFLWVKSWDNET